jgi:hypothetical protein
MSEERPQLVTPEQRADWLQCLRAAATVHTTKDTALSTPEFADRLYAEYRARCGK